MLEATEDGFNSQLGIELVSVERERVVGRLIAKTQHLNGEERVHGGVIMALADAVAAHGTVVNLDGGSTTTIESKTNFFRAGRCGTLSAEAVPLHIGRSTMVWQTTVRNDDESTVAIVIQTQMVLHDKEGLSASNASRKIDGAAARSAVHPEDNPPTAELSTAERRRAQILEAAFRVISRKGFASASMREIAREAGMPIPTMYQYLRSKDEILATIFDTYLGAVEASVQSSSTGVGAAADRLKAAIAANLAEFDRYQGQIRVMNRETRALQPEVRERVTRHMLNYIGLFRDIIADGIKSGEFRAVDPDLFANFIPMLCEVWPLRQWSVGSYGVDAVQAGIVSLVLHGLSKDLSK